jgi:ABC-type multidrug transport system fused ATPase/permease subunit
MLNGVDIDEVSLSYLRKTVNYVNQETLLFDSSVLSNIGYGNAVSESEILSLIRRYGLDTVYSSLSGGVESGLCGKNGSSLSGGMQKVTMVLRGILKGGNILILDEPLAGLDKTTIVKMLKLITEENVGATKIIISHDNAIMPYMDKVIDITKL